VSLSESFPTIIHFYGNGESVQDYLGDFKQRIVGLGANLLLAEYCGYGMSSGKPALAAILEDVRLIVEACAVPPERIQRSKQSHVRPIYIITFA